MKKNLKNSKLIAYSAAAGAALAIAPNAFGNVIHSTVNIDFGNGYGEKQLTMEGSTAEFKFNKFPSTNGFFVSGMGNSGKIYVATSYVKALSTGQYIGSTENLPNESSASFTYYGNGDWSQVGENKMFGMSFLLEGGTQNIVYGWIAVEKIAVAAGKITAWGYENDGTKIKVGTIPEPVAGLALLALGVAGIARYRKVA